MAEPGTPPVLGIIGGSGIYEIEGLADLEWRRIESPFGEPSDELLFGRLDGQRIIFLPRHGRGHVAPPTQVNFRANIDALKRSGVTEIISLSAVGSLKEELPPGTFVLIDQFIDRTFGRQKSFFGTGMVAHVSMSDPVCGRLGDHLQAAASEIDITCVRGGTYMVMEGPQFSSRAESELYRSWGCSVIGMTNMPEAKLAREAELCYATVAMVTDYDCWHDDHDDVTVDQVIKVLQDNAASAKSLLRVVIPRLRSRETRCGQGCHTTLGAALMTAPDKRDPTKLAQLEAITRRVLDQG